MNCPYCGKKMVKGYIYGRRDTGVLWNPEEARPHFGLNAHIMEEEGILALIPPNVFSLSIPKLPTYLCEECKSGVIRYGEAEREK